MQVESNQLVLKTDCGIFVDRQRNCCAAASAAGGEHRKDKGVAILDYALGNRPSTGGGGRPAVPPTRPAPVGSRRGGNPESFRPIAARPQPATKKAPAGRDREITPTDRHNRRKKSPSGAATS